jgi:hypothetical protein
MYNVWIVNSITLEPITLSAAYSDPHECLASASMILKGLGAPLLTAKNVTDPWHRGDEAPSMLVYDPSRNLPVSALVEGACLCEEGLPMPPGETTATVAMIDASPEIH